MRNSFFAFATIYFLVLSLDASAQKDSTTVKKDRKPISDKLVFGGNLGLSFGTVTYIEVSPTVGYKVTDNFLTGVGINYNYYDDRFVSGSLYGPSVFARLNIFDGFFAHTEFQQTYSSFKFAGVEEKVSNDFPMFLVGGGGYTSLGGNARIGISVLFDVLEDPNNTFYQNPIIRGGVMVGF